MNVIGCVVFIIHIMVVFHLLTFIESNLQRREYHFVNKLTRLTFIVCNMWGVEESNI